MQVTFVLSDFRTLGQSCVWRGVEGGGGSRFAVDIYSTPCRDWGSKHNVEQRVVYRFVTIFIFQGPITASQNASTGARACDDVDPILQQGQDQYSLN